MSEDSTKKYDLEERTATFGENIIDFVNRTQKTITSTSLLKQLVRSGTSIGANYCEADCAESKKDFVHKIGICKKEAKETKHWLRMIAKALPESATEARLLWFEADQLQRIFITIITRTKENDRE
jgi:four helix bundle protein